MTSMVEAPDNRPHGCASTSSVAQSRDKRMAEFAKNAILRLRQRNDSDGIELEIGATATILKF
jgi:hypothetical protein